MRLLGSIVLLVVMLATMPARGAESSSTRAETPAQRGYRVLTTKPFLPPDFDQEVFDELWKAWEEPLRSQAEKATPAERRKMAFSRYGLTNTPGRDDGVALQYVDDGQGGWVMNCLACHGGKVAGRVIPGLPNSMYLLQTLTEDVRATKLRMKKTLTHMDYGSMAVPLGGSQGTTNAVMFGKLLLSHRDSDLNFHREYPIPKLVHHDSDPPPWWQFKRKQYIYIDGFAPKGHRALMQFLLIPRNGPEQFRAWEENYRDVAAWIESLEPPPYPWAIDRQLAARGEGIFNKSCAKCHGTYGAQGTYPEKIIPIDEVGTDRVRLDALSVSGRVAYAKSWFARDEALQTIVDPGGYVAPPLDGVWASAPYLHNGSVPTLWHLLHADARPVVWQRSEDGYDQQKVGLEIKAFEDLPPEAKTARDRRRYFNTRLFGKSAEGHLFPEALSEDEKHAVLEYLKTL
jgi:cytochrome c553